VLLPKASSLNVPVPPSVKDTLCEVHHSLLFAGVLSCLKGGKDALVTEIDWMGWLDRRFLFLLMLWTCFVTCSVLLIAVACCVFL